MLRPASIFPTAALNSSAAVLLFAAVPLLAQGEEAWLPLPAGPIQRIAFGSCAKHWQPQPIWDAVIAKKPDLFIFLGDNIYAKAPNSMRIEGPGVALNFGFVEIDWEAGQVGLGTVGVDGQLIFNQAISFRKLDPNP